MRDLPYPRPTRGYVVTARRIPLDVSRIAPAAVAGGAGPATHADENLLRGPPPVPQGQPGLRARAGRDRPGRHHERRQAGLRLRLQADRRRDPAWLDLASASQHGACTVATARRPVAQQAATSSRRWAASSGSSRRRSRSSRTWARSAGSRSRSPTARRRHGIVVRAVGGANYFFVDWLGVGLQVGYSLGTSATTTPSPAATPTPSSISAAASSSSSDGPGGSRAPRVARPGHRPPSRSRGLRCRRPTWASPRSGCRGRRR